jgi:thiamine biosynthesis lipoprotein
VRRAEACWGTVVSIDLSDDVDERVLDDVFAWFARVDALFSTWRDDSEIVRLGNGTLLLDETSPDVRTVLVLCDRVRDETGGAFDVRAGAHPDAPPAPGRGPIDPSGLVKGWAVERAGEILEHAGARRFHVNAGGDVLVRGTRDGGARWRVGIQHPWERNRLAAVVAACDLAVATSGRYERGDHVLDPRTGRPVTGLASVTVVGPDLALADGYATALMVMGRSGLQWITSRDGYDAMVITDDARVVSTAGFARHRVE